MTEQEKLQKYWGTAKSLKSDDEKIAFFDSNEDAFYLDPQEGDEFQNAKLSYCAERNFSEDETQSFEDQPWQSLPKEFKLYAFQYCILEGIGYGDIQDLMSTDEIISLVSLDRINDQLENDGIFLSEAEEEVMLILEKNIKNSGKKATEDDLYDATKKVIGQLRDWLDDNHPDNLAA
ncbi:hypothetical protein [Prochlorococcus marinus]|uniref:Uncharacterized protein n=1 Tax=Prochlorococcus marinus (strain MIT 9211) TaxID=93059 RepID=A9BB96_PROM4|nr:hypothetical protein [Prochlorococcus marinus]ABX09108.1 Hypothetical protein P9211_11771 [Prochlorococcus marinus str. MIT 9211]